MAQSNQINSLEPMAPNQLENIDVATLLRPIRKHKYAILGFTFATLLLAFSILQIVKPTYQSSAKVLIEPESAQVVNVDQIFGMGDFSEHYNTQLAIIKSRATMLTAIKELKLWNKPEFEIKAREKSQNNILLDFFGFATDERPAPVTDDDFAELVLEDFEDKFTIGAVRKSQLVEIKFESENPELSRNIVTAISSAYLNNDRNSKFETTNEINTWLNARLDELKTNLINAENKLQTFRERKGVLDVEGSVQSIAANQISETSQQLISAQVKQAELESIITGLKQITDGDYSTIPAIMSDELVLISRATEARVESKMSEIKSRYGEGHPSYSAILAEYNSAKTDTQKQMESVANSLYSQYEMIKSTVATLQTAVNSSKASLQNVNRYMTQLNVLKRDVDSHKSIYETFLDRAKQTGNTNELQNSVGRIVEKPALGKKIKPKKPIILAVALFSALLLSCLAAIWYEKLDNTIKGAEHAESELGIPVLTSLPIIDNKSEPELGFEIINAPDSLFAEGIRTANTGVSLTSLDDSQKTILVTSSVAGEGKSTFSLNLALSMASSRKVLLIDGDMRRPKIHKLLNQTFRLGIANALISKIAINSVKVKVPNSNLTVLPVGVVPKEPLDLIQSEKFERIMATLKKQYDMIIIDSPPVQLVSDALAYTPYVDGLIYVVRCMDTPLPVVSQGVKKIMGQGVDIIGTVINQVNFKESHDYYGEYSAYKKYGYTGYGYTSDSANEDINSDEPDMKAAS